MIQAKALNMDGQDEQDKTQRTGQGRWKLKVIVARNRGVYASTKARGIRKSKATNMDGQDGQDKTKRINKTSQTCA